MNVNDYSNFKNLPFQSINHRIDKYQFLPEGTFYDDFIDCMYVDINVVISPEHEPWRLPVAVEGRPVQAEEVLQGQERLHCVVAVRLIAVHLK